MAGHIRSLFLNGEWQYISARGQCDMRATRNTMPSHSSSHSRAPKASRQADITAVSRYLSRHSADQNASIVGAQLGPPCAHGAPGDEVPHWRSRRAPQPTSTFRRTSRRRCTSTWACRGRSSRPPLERIPIRSPSRSGGTLRPLAAGHSSQPAGCKTAGGRIPCSRTTRQASRLSRGTRPCGEWRACAACTEIGRTHAPPSQMTA